MNVTLKRGSTEVTFKLWRDGSGQLAFARDIGKPFQTLHESGVLYPQHGDHLSSVETWTMLGVVEGPTAYQDARALAEDLVRPYSDGEPLTLDATTVSGITDTVEIGVPTDNALNLAYSSGVHDLVDLQLSVPLVSRTVG